MYTSKINSRQKPTHARPKTPPPLPRRTVLPANSGPMSTHTSRSCTTAVSDASSLWIAAAVNMSPG
jgi:hypothetical protein